jgi:hypothetical protein
VAIGSTGASGTPAESGSRYSRCFSFHAYEHSQALGNNDIGSEHLLLGLIAEGESPGARILVEHGTNLEATLREVRAAQAEAA